MEKEYVIEDRTFIQKPLVWGQVKQLLVVLEGLVIPQGAPTIEVIKFLGDKLPEAMAVVLTEKGTSLKDKDLKELTTLFDFFAPIEVIKQVIEDFFVCNPIVSTLGEKIEGILKGLKIQTEPIKDTLTEQLSSLAEETSAKEI